MFVMEFLLHSDQLQLEGPVGRTVCGSLNFSKWPNDWMVAVVKHCWPFVQGRSSYKERWLKTSA